MTLIKNIVFLLYAYFRLAALIGGAFGFILLVLLLWLYLSPRGRCLWEVIKHNLFK